MSAGAYLAGAAFAVAVWGCAAAAGWLVVRRRLAHLDRLEQLVAGATVATAALIAIHLVPLMATVLSRGTVLAAAALALLGTALLVRAPLRPAVEEPGAPAVVRSGRASWTLAGLAVVAVGASMLGYLRDEAVLPFTNVDTLLNHLPVVGAWMASGSLWHLVDFQPLLASGAYPQNGDLVSLAAVLPWHSDFLVRWLWIPFLGLTAGGVTVAARELRAPRATGLLLGAAVLAVPVLGMAAVKDGMPDMVLAGSFAAGLAFLVRHRRSGRRADLVVAALGLGIAFGTKWYGTLAVPILWAVWLATGLLAPVAGRARRRVLADAALFAGVVALAGGIWLLRNWVLAGDPFFPARISLFGWTVWDAPPDLVRDLTGFTLAHYLGQPSVLRHPILDQLSTYLGLPALALFAAAAVGVVVLAVRRRAGRGAWLIAAAVVLALAYLVTPDTALGPEGSPVLAGANSRYALPALIAAAMAGGWALGRLGARTRVVAEVLLLAAVIAGVRSAFPVSGGRFALGLLALAVVAAGVLVARRAGRRTVPLAAGGAAVAIVVAAVGFRVADRYLDARYTGGPPTIAAVADHAPSGHRVGVAGRISPAVMPPVLPAFGPRFGNTVRYVGPRVDGLPRTYGSAAAFAAALDRGGYDLLYVGLEAPLGSAATGAELVAWARADGYAVAARSAGLVLLERRSARNGRSTSR